MAGRHGVRLAAVALCLLASAARADPPPTPEAGHFRGGSIAWTSLGGNEVEFEILSSWRRSHNGHYLHGSPAMGQIFIGDEVTVGGQSSPRLLFGDDSFAYLVVKVTDYSEADDWFSGVYRVNHSYSNPNQGWRNTTSQYGEVFVTQGSPWEAAFTGCCRLPNLINAAGEAWSLEAPIDLVQISGMPSLRSKDMMALARTALPTPVCPIPGKAFGAMGGCAKLHFSGIKCGEQTAEVGEIGTLLASKAEPVVNGLEVYPDGTVQMACQSGCLAAGLYSIGIKLGFGTVKSIQVTNDGNGTCAVGTWPLTVTCPGAPAFKALCLAAGGGHAAGSYTVAANGKVSGVTLSSQGSGYLYGPSFASGACPRAAFAPVLLQTELNVVVHVQDRHYCYETTDPTIPKPEKPCNPDNPLIVYTGAVLPQMHLTSFPGIGAGWDPVRKAATPVVTGFLPSVTSFASGAAGQAAAGHVAAYAGYPVKVTFSAEVNWCQAADTTLTAAKMADARCRVREAGVSLSYGPMPPNAHYSFVQPDAITDLLITYDNPFASHRPGQEHAVDRMARDFANHPGAEQAAQMGYERVDANLNSGNGGASVYLWFKRFDAASNNTDQAAITHINVSTTGPEEETLASRGFQKLPGNINEQAGGNEVYIWYKKASGIVSFEESRPLQAGFEVAVTNISVVSSTAAVVPVGAGCNASTTNCSDINPYALGRQGLGNLWTKVDGNLNAGLQNPLLIYYHKALSNPVEQTVEWTPCACDAGRHMWCVAAQSTSASADGYGRATGPMRCVAVDVVADVLPIFALPPADSSILFFMGQERRVPIELLVYNPAKEMVLEAGDDLPAGAALDRVHFASSGCVGDVCQTQARDLVWTPAYDQGGLDRLVCFHARNGRVSGCEPDGQAAVSERCFRLQVQKCVYAIQYEQHLSEIASLFRTDWVNLFSMNPTVKAPDRVLYAGQLINIGHLYSVVPGDTLAAISQRFGTNVATLLSLNANLDQDHIQSGDKLCILPDSCSADRT
mmetsp:Transcript_21020/g.50710  ORF Transcript_21020/g.50710 Transcript_21020/m.50710 type:complete len:1015 (-) Transcript_21020:65-3109(-)